MEQGIEILVTLQRTPGQEFRSTEACVEAVRTRLGEALDVEGSEHQVIDVERESERL
jgi:hypothetical protein